MIYLYCFCLCTLLSIKSTALDGFEEEEECLAQAVYEQLQLDENPVVKEDLIHCYFLIEHPIRPLLCLYLLGF